MVPVLHIVGVPNTSQQKAKPMLHHTLGDGRFDAYQKAAEQFTIAQVQLDDAETAAKDIDRVLEACITKVRISPHLGFPAANLIIHSGPPGVSDGTHRHSIQEDQVR